MSKKESILIPFLLDGLQNEKYGEDLVYVNENTFKMVMPHKSKLKDHQGIKNLLKDWDALKKHNFDYTKSNRRMKSALRKSMYLEHCIGEDSYQWTYRFLQADEVKSKKLRQKSKSTDHQPPSSVESGYHSFVSPDSDSRLALNNRESTEGPSTSNAFQSNIGGSNVTEGESINLNQDHNEGLLSDGTVRNHSNSTDVEMEEINLNHIDIETEQSVEEIHSNVALQSHVESLNVVEVDSNNLNQDHNVDPFSDGTVRNPGNMADSIVNETNLSHFENEREQTVEERTSSYALHSNVGSLNVVNGDSNVPTDRNVGNMADANTDEFDFNFDDIESYYPSVPDSACDEMLTELLSTLPPERINQFPDIEREQSVEEIHSNVALQSHVENTNVIDIDPNNLNEDHNVDIFSNGTVRDPENSDGVIVNETIMTESNNAAENKIYIFKSETRLENYTCIICEKKNLAAVESPAYILESCGLVLDADLFRRIQNQRIDYMFSRDNHLFLYLSPQGNVFGV